MGVRLLIIANKYDVERAEVVMRGLIKIVRQLMATIKFIVVIVLVATAIVVLWLSKHKDFLHSDKKV